MADIRDRWAAAILNDSNISGGCIRTAWALREYANKQGQTTVGESRLAKDTGQNKRTVERHIHNLTGLGYLSRTPGAGVKTLGGTTTLTKFRLPEDGKVPAARPTLDYPKVPAAGPAVSPQVSTASTESTGGNGRKYRQSFAGQTINHIEPARGRARGGVARAALRRPKSMREIVTDPGTGLLIEFDDGDFAVRDSDTCSVSAGGSEPIADDQRDWRKDRDAALRTLGLDQGCWLSASFTMNVEWGDNSTTNVLSKT